MKFLTFTAAFLISIPQVVAQDSLPDPDLIVTGAFRNQWFFEDWVSGPEVNLRYKRDLLWYDAQLFLVPKGFDYRRMELQDDYHIIGPSFARASLLAGFMLIDRQHTDFSRRRSEHLQIGLRGGWFYYQQTLYRSYGNTVNLTDTVANGPRTFRSGVRRHNLMIGAELFFAKDKQRRNGKWHRNIHRLSIDGFVGIHSSFTGFQLELEPWGPYYRWSDQATVIPFSQKPAVSHALGARLDYTYIHGIGKHFGLTFSAKAYFLEVPEHPYMPDKWGDVRGFTGKYPPFAFAPSVGIRFY